MHERETFSETFVRLAFSDLGKEYGEKNFERFVELARKSTIPSTFTEAWNTVSKGVKKDQNLNLEEACLQTASKIFEREFTNITLAVYLMTYTEALVLTKDWLTFSEILTKTNKEAAGAQNFVNEFRDLVNREAMPELKDAILSIIQTQEDELNRALAVQAKNSERIDIIKGLAIIKCGHTSLLEEQGRNLKTKDKIIEKMAGRYVTSEDLSRLRDEVENYFSNPLNVAKLKILAKAGK